MLQGTFGSQSRSRVHHVHLLVDPSRAFHGPDGRYIDIRGNTALLLVHGLSLLHRFDFVRGFVRVYFGCFHYYLCYHVFCATLSAAPRKPPAAPRSKSSSKGRTRAAAGAAVAAAAAAAAENASREESAARRGSSGMLATRFGDTDGEVGVERDSLALGNVVGSQVPFLPISGGMVSDLLMVEDPTDKLNSSLACQRNHAARP